MITLREYLDSAGRSRFEKWFYGLDVSAATKVATALERLTQGHTANIKSVGSGVSEHRIDFGPGYRIYFGRDGALLIILLGGGTKKKQSNDIADAQAAWQAYKQQKREQPKTDSTAETRQK